MSRVKKCVCGWKTPTFVAKVEPPDGMDPKTVEELKRCMLETTLICPRCGTQFNRKVLFGDIVVIEAELASFVSRGGPPS